MRIKDMITKRNYYDLTQILPISTIRKCMGTSEEILYFDTATLRVKVSKVGSGTKRCLG